MNAYGFRVASSTAVSQYLALLLYSIAPYVSRLSVLRVMQVVDCPPQLLPKHYVRVPKCSSLACTDSVSVFKDLHG